MRGASPDGIMAAGNLAENGGSEEEPYVCGATLPLDRLIRIGLRVLMVDLAPICFWPFPQSYHRVWSLLSRHPRARAHYWQGWCGDAPAPDGALARAAGVVRGGAAAPRGDQRRCSLAQRRGAGR